MRNAAILAFAVAFLLSSVDAGAVDRDLLKKHVFDPPAEALDLKKVELGRRLFFDRRLSGDSTMNCATCHQTGEGFSDGLEVSVAYPTNRHFRNTPTVVNAAWRKFLTWDGRAKSVEEQALGPIGSPFEMNMDLAFMEEKLKIVPAYRRDFADAFGGEITKDMVAAALGAFERTLKAGKTPFDRYASGEESALGDREKAGMEVFFGNGGCVECHTGEHFGGESFASLGLPPDPKNSGDPQRAAALRYFARTRGARLQFGAEDDLGKGFEAGKTQGEGEFIVPTLRQLARTAPYGHDGRFGRLEEVLELLNAGGGVARHKSSKLKPLNLSREELDALKAFLLALTGDDPVVRPPAPPY